MRDSTKIRENVSSDPFGGPSTIFTEVETLFYIRQNCTGYSDVNTTSKWYWVYSFRSHCVSSQINSVVLKRYKKSYVKPTLGFTFHVLFKITVTELNPGVFRFQHNRIR